MNNKAIFFLFLSSIFCNAESLQFLSVQEFKESIALSQNKKAFLDNYLRTINELDIEVNSIIATYDSSETYKAYVY